MFSVGRAGSGGGTHKRRKKSPLGANIRLQVCFQILDSERGLSTDFV